MKIPETGIPDFLRLFPIPCRKGEKIMMKTEELKLTQEWDKVFPKSDNVIECSVFTKPGMKIHDVS